MTTNSFEAKVTQLFIKKLKTVSDVTKYVGTGDNAKIYTAFLATIKDYELPAISIQALPSTGQSIDDAGMQEIDMQLDLWFPNRGANAYVWDDVMECFEAMKDELHNNGGWDNDVGINIMMIENISRGPAMYEDDTKIMHYQSRFRTRGTVQ